jgi:type IV pilus assembly protein PilO
MRRGVLAAIIGGAVLLIIAWYFLLFAPTSNDLNDTRDEVSAAESQKQELENAIRRLKELSANQTQQEADLRTLRAAIPPTPDLGEFILQANEIASASGIDWLSVSPSPPVASGANSTIALSIQIDGGFFQVLDYLNRMEDMDRLVIVDGVSVSSGAENAGGGTDSSSTGGSSTTFDSGSDSSGGAPSLSVTLTARMFTGQAPPTTGTGGTATAGGGTTTTPTTPATTPSATGAS